MESDKPEIFQTNVIPNPVNIPATAPCRVTFFQYNVKSINGPKLAPLSPKNRWGGGAFNSDMYHGDNIKPPLKVQIGQILVGGF